MRGKLLLALVATTALAGCGTGAPPVGATGTSVTEPASTQAGGTVVGSGRIVTETRDVRDFTEVDLSGIGDLVIEQTGTESLTIEAADNVLPLLGSAVSGGVLTLGPVADSHIVDSGPITYRLTVRSMEALTVSGAGEVTASGIDGSALRVSLNGAGDITVDGRVDSQVVDVEGAGEYDGEDLRSSTAEVTVDGAGSAVVQVSDRLAASVSGVGSIEYIGDPAVTSDVSGVGSIQRR